MQWSNTTSQWGAVRLQGVSQCEWTSKEAKQEKKKIFLKSGQVRERTGGKGHLKTQQAFLTSWFHWGPKSTQRWINYLMARSLTSLMKSWDFQGKNVLAGLACLWVWVGLVPAAFPSANMTHEMTQIAGGLCYYVTFSKSPFLPASVIKSGWQY